ncbi:MAG: hypothetical protein ACLQEI_15585, partial [Terriglobales bacterium]
VTAALQQRAPAAIHFRTGLVKPTADEKPDDPNYRLLEKAGIVKVAKAAGGKVEISLTPAGDQLLASVAGCKKEKEADGTDSYEVPLAQRQLVALATSRPAEPTPPSTTPGSGRPINSATFSMRAVRW